MASPKQDKASETPEARRRSAVTKADKSQGAALAEIFSNNSNDQQNQTAVNYDFAYIAHMGISSAATLMLKFASLFSPIYDMPLQAVVQLEVKTKATDIIAGGSSAVTRTRTSTRNTCTSIRGT